MPVETCLRGFDNFSAPFGTQSDSPTSVLMPQKSLRQSQYSFYTDRVSKDITQFLHPNRRISMPSLGPTSSKSLNLTHTTPIAQPMPISAPFGTKSASNIPVPMPQNLLRKSQYSFYTTQVSKDTILLLPLPGLNVVTNVATATLHPLLMPLPGLTANTAVQLPDTAPPFTFPLPLPVQNDVTHVATATLHMLSMPPPGLTDTIVQPFSFPLPLPGLNDVTQVATMIIQLLPMLLPGLTDPAAQPFLVSLPLPAQYDVTQIANANLQLLPMPLPGPTDPTARPFLLPLPRLGVNDTAHPYRIITFTALVRSIITCFAPV